MAKVEACLPAIVTAADAIIQCLQRGETVSCCANGRRAADAQHLAAELVSRYLRERKALAAIALTTDTSVLTAVGNDHSFASVFERQVLAQVRTGDVLVTLSTSGQSESVMRAATAARACGATVIGMTGDAESTVVRLADVAIRVPTSFTPSIQVAHIAIGHALCEIIETEVAPEPS